MKLAAASGLLALGSIATAFPTILLEDIKRESPELLGRSANIQARTNGDAPLMSGDLKFSEDQLVDVTGAHAFTPPGPNDIRGPCPGLNALANHNYIPHNGVATVAQFVSACKNVVGMGFYLGGFLSVYGATFNGDGKSWSIGGQIPGNPSGGNGISNSHNNYECDASPVKGDLYQEGNAYKTKVDQFQALIDTQPDKSTANYNIPVLTDFRAKRFDQQVATNPYFFNGPFSGIAVQPAAYTFIYRFMANHSAADPVGVLNQDVLKSWFGVSGESGAFTVQDGWERIPNNWYRRSLEESYDADYFFADVRYAAKKYPRLVSVGGNTGTGNSFTAVNIENLTAGAYSPGNLLQGNNLLCFAYQFTAQAKPDSFLGRLTPLTDALSPILSHFGCGKMQSVDTSQLAALPGYNRQFSPVRL